MFIFKKGGANDDTKIKTYHSGLRLGVQKLPIKSVHFGVRVKCGAKDESKSQEGYAHLIEHMHFRSTLNKTYREAKDEINFLGTY